MEFITSVVRVDEYMIESKLLELLGKDKNSIVVNEFVNSIEEFFEYSEIDEDSFYEWKKSGFCLKFEENRLVAIFLYGSKEEGFETYKGVTPFGVKFDWSRKKVREQLGQPAKSGHAKAFKDVLPESTWDRYDFSEFLMNITYTSTDCLSIKMITLMPSF